MVNFSKNQMETSKVTSKTSSLKGLLLKAWGERWTDLQWGTHIKTILPRGVSGDVYNLADIILQQALIGLGPNQLVLSYLKHSLSSQLVSYAAVLQRISKYDGFHKPYCILSLLEFLEKIQNGITCKGKPEESILPGASLSLTYWLLQCVHHAYLNPSDLQQDLVNKTLGLLQLMLQCKFTCAMLYVAKHENKDLYVDVIKKTQDIVTCIEQNREFIVNESFQSTLQDLITLDILFKHEDQPECITLCMQPLFAIQVMTNPNCHTQVLANQLLMLKRLKNYSYSRLYFELIRSSLMSLNDVLDTGEESQWGAFTFIKLPHVIQKLFIDNSDDIVDCFEMLLELFPLLDILDARCACNTVESLLTELEKLHIVSEQQCKQIIEKRKEATVNLHSPETIPPSISKVIICAEPTLARVLRTLDTEFSKIQDALLNVLSQVLNGKSFDLILAVAAVEGKLCTFVTKLIKFNECSKNSNPSDSSKGAQTKVMLFDITFLMLCSIVQRYGSKIVFSENGGDSFFEKWVRDCMVEGGRPKPHKKMLDERNQMGVEDLLRQFNTSDNEFKNCPKLNCYEICMNIPAVIYDVLGAWETSVLSSTDVKRILDAMRSRMCCLPVCAAAWLCSYMQVIHQEALLKPMNMVQQFLTALTVDETPQQDFFKERSMLMVQIIRKMQCDVFPPITTKNKVITLTHCIVSKGTINEQLYTVWENSIQKGWLTIEAAHTFQSMMNTCGVEWLVSNLIKEMLKLLFEFELNKAVNLVFSIFHLDIEKCTVRLLDILPQYLHNKFLSGDLHEPQSSALAKLTAYCIYAAAQVQPVGGTKKKRNDFTDDLDDLCPANKILRLSGIDPTESDALVFLNNGTKSSNQSKPLQDPLLSSVKSLFSYLLLIAGMPSVISQQTHFVLKFLEFLVFCGKDNSSPVLQHLPSGLVPNIIRALPDCLSTNVLLRLYDLNTLAGRRDTSRDLCLLRNMMIKSLSHNLS